MPNLILDVPHTLGQAPALERLKNKFSLAKDMYQAHISHLQEEWNDTGLTFDFRAAGMNVSGTLAVEEAAVKLKAHLPLAALLFKGAIEKQVREELERLLR
jgi:hypothetical protein